MNIFRVIYRRWKTSVLCVIVYVVVINIVCLIYLSRYPSPWISQHGPFFLAHLRSTGYSCRPVGFSPNPLPLTALASFPGSGNTWLRHLVQQATGLVTGSIYNDVILKQHGFPGEGINDSRVVLIKTHEWGEQHRGKFSRAVLLVRDPFDSLLAEFNRRHGGHRGQALPHDFQMGWEKYVYLQSQAWREMNTDWLKFQGPLLVLQYQNLQKNILNETRKLFDFLRIGVSESELACMVANSQGKFKRRKFKVLQRNPFTEYMNISIRKHIDNVTHAIQNHSSLHHK